MLSLSKKGLWNIYVAKNIKQAVKNPKKPKNLKNLIPDNKIPAAAATSKIPVKYKICVACSWILEGYMHSGINFT